MKEYFYNKNYIAIYIHNICENFASSLVSVFGAVLLYKLGFPVWAILFFYAFQFGLMGLLSPLSPISVSKIGIHGSVFLSSIFKVLGVAIILFAGYFSHEIIFLSFVLFAIAEGIYNPLPNSIVSYYIQDVHKGRVNSLITISNALTIAVSITLGAYFIANSRIIELLILIIISYCLGVGAYRLFLDRFQSTGISPSFKSVFQYMVHARFRENLIPFGLETFLIIEILFLPLFVYIFVGDIQIVSYIVSFALFVEIIILLSFGRRIDRFVQNSFFQATIMKSVASFSFLFLTINIWWTFICNTCMKMSYSMFQSSFQTLLQKKARQDNNPIVFSAAKEMILCFTEFFILLFFGGICYFFGNIIFMIIFISASLSAAGIYLMWKN